MPRYATPPDYVVVQSFTDHSGIIKIIGPLSLDHATDLYSKMSVDPSVEGIVSIMPLALPEK